MFEWLTLPLPPMDTTTLVLILIFVFAVVALLVLPAASFIRLVELIVSNGSKVEVLMQEVLHLRTILSDAKERDSASPPQDTTLTTPASPSSPLTESTQETKSLKS